MTTARVLKGTKREIAEDLARIDGEVREAIVFVEVPPTPVPPANAPDAAAAVDNIFAEMQPYMVDAADVDDSREAVYTRMDGEQSCRAADAPSQQTAITS